MMNDNLQEDIHKSEDLQGSSDISLRRRELIDHLDKEINNLSSEIQRPGWTNYAILGSIGTLVWLLLYCFEVGGYSLINVAFFILVFLLLKDLIALLSPTVRSPRLNLKLKRRFISGNILSGNGLALILIVGEYAFLLFVALRLSEDLDTFTIILTSTFLSLILVFMLLTIIIILFLKLPMPMSPPRKRLNIVINTIFIVLSSVIIFRYLSFLLVSPSVTLITDIRLALLIVAIFYLLLILCRVPRGKLILESLMMTRRELALGEINLDMATIQTEIALTGLRTSDILEQYIIDLLSLYREATNDLHEASHYLQDVEILYAEKQNDQGKQTSFAHPLLETVKKLITTAGDIVNTKIPKAQGRLQMRVFWITTQVGTSDTVEELNRKLGDVQKDLLEQVKNVGERLEPLVDLKNQDQTANSGQPHIQNT